MKRLSLLICLCCSLTAAFPAAAERERDSRREDYSARETDFGHQGNYGHRDERREQFRQRRDQLSPEQRDQIRRDVYDYGRDSNRGRRGDRR